MSSHNHKKIQSSGKLSDILANKLFELIEKIKHDKTLSPFEEKQMNNIRKIRDDICEKQGKNKAYVILIKDNVPHRDPNLPPFGSIVCLGNIKDNKSKPYD